MKFFSEETGSGCTECETLREKLAEITAERDGFEQMYLERHEAKARVLRGQRPDSNGFKP